MQRPIGTREHVICEILSECSDIYVNNLFLVYIYKVNAVHFSRTLVEFEFQFSQCKHVFNVCLHRKKGRKGVERGCDGIDSNLKNAKVPF